MRTRSRVHSQGWGLWKWTVCPDWGPQSSRHSSRVQEVGHSRRPGPRRREVFPRLAPSSLLLRSLEEVIKTDRGRGTSSWALSRHSSFAFFTSGALPSCLFPFKPEIRALSSHASTKDPLLEAGSLALHPGPSLLSCWLVSTKLSSRVCWATFCLPKSPLSSPGP